MEGRKSELIWLNVLFCLVVVFIHVLSDSLAVLNPESWQYYVIFLPQKLAFVAVPGFFFLSGLKLMLNPPQKLTRYYWKRIRTILLPYLVAVAVYYWIYTSLEWYPVSFSLLCEFWWNGRIGAHFYFIVCLLQFILLTPVWFWLVRRYHPLVVLPLCVVISLVSTKYLDSYMALIAPSLDFLGASRTFTTWLFFFLMGCYIGHDYDRAIALLQKNRNLIFGATVIFAQLVCLGFGFSGRISISGLNEINFTFEAFGILALLLLVEKLPTPPSAILHLDRTTYLIYLYHMLFVVLFPLCVPQTMDAGLHLILRALFVYGISIGLCLIWHQGVSFIKKLRKEGIVHE